MEYFLFIHYEPILLMKAKTKKECIAKVRSLGKISNDIRFLNFVETVTDSAIGRLIFYTQVNEYKNNIVFHTYRKKRGGFKHHLSFSLCDNYIKVPPEIVNQYKFFKRKEKIKNLLNES